MLTQTCHGLDDIGRSLSWDALDAFFAYIEPESALMKELNPDTHEWSTRLKTNRILADIHNILAQINANLVAVGSGKPAKKPDPYPTPWRDQNTDEQHFGKGALPPDELRKWFEKKRAENNARNCSSDNNCHSSTKGCTGIIN